MGDYIRVAWRMTLSDDHKDHLEESEEQDRQEFLQELVLDVTDGRTMVELAPDHEQEDPEAEIRGTKAAPVPAAVILYQRVLLDLSDPQTIQRFEDAISELTAVGARVQVSFGGLGAGVDSDMAPPEEAPERMFT